MDFFDLRRKQSAMCAELQALAHADLESDIKACDDGFGACGLEDLTGIENTLPWSRH